MTIQIELNPETEARLASEAQRLGVAPEAYAGALLQDALSPPSQESGRLTVQEVQAMLDGIAEGSEQLPKVATSSFSRESFYEDRP
jgi:hypothetical protein